MRGCWTTATISWYVSTEWIHETDLNRIRRDIFTPQSDCWSFGCYTGASMSRWWKRIVGVPSGATRNPPATAPSLTAGCRKARENGLNSGACTALSFKDRLPKIGEPVLLPFMESEDMPDFQSDMP